MTAIAFARDMARRVSTGSGVRRFSGSIQPSHVTFVSTSAAVAAFVAGIAVAPVRTWSNVLLDGYYIVTLALGGMLFIAIQHLAGAKWPLTVRRAAGAVTAALPIGAAMLLAIFFGRTLLYRWAASPMPYLSTRMVFSRMLVFLGSWIFFSRLFRRGGTPRSAAAFAVVFAVSFSLATVDWLMSLAPHWTTTMFAVYHFAGVLVAGGAAVTFIVATPSASAHRDAVPEHELHDLGKMLFAFTTFWAYLWLCQYLLIWYTNLPEEIGFYVIRTGGGWRVWFFVNVIVNWLVPFVLLLGRTPKRHRAVLRTVCVVLFAGHWLDLYLSVMPQTLPAPAFGVLELAIAAGAAGVAIARIESQLLRSTVASHA